MGDVLTEGVPRRAFLKAEAHTVGHRPVVTEGIAGASRSKDEAFIAILVRNVAGQRVPVCAAEQESDEATLSSSRRHVGSICCI